MRIYLSKKQGKYHPGFYPPGRVPMELVNEWLNTGIACPASDDNKTHWPNGKGPEPRPESPESIKARDDACAAAALHNAAEAVRLAAEAEAIENTGLLLDDEAGGDYDNG